MKKRVIAFLVIVALAVTLLVGTVAPTASADADAYKYVDAYKAFEDFAVMSNRTVGTEYELAAANWLAQQLTALGYVNAEGSSLSGDMCVPFTFSYKQSVNYFQSKEVTEHSYNVVAYKRCGRANAPLLVIAAPYSNELTYAYDGSAAKLEDAAYSASSAGVLLSVAAKLYAAKDLSYDVAFAFMGAEYFYSAGTKAFLRTNTQPLIGAIYLSQVGVGDHLNAYYDEVSTPHGDFVDGEAAKWSDYDIQGKPFDPGYTAQIYGGDLPYAHVGLSGGNYIFMQENVPAVHLFGYNWAGGAAGSESATHGDIVFTEDDTFDNLVKLYGRDAIAKRLNDAADFVKILVLRDADFAAALSASANRPSYHPLVSDGMYYGLKWGLVGLVILVTVALALMLIRKSKEAGTPDFSVNSEFVNGQAADASSADDVFGEYGAPVEGDSADVDTGEGDDGDSDSNNTGNPPDTNDIFGEF